MASAPMSQRPVSLFTATHPIPGAWNGTAPNTPAPISEDVKTIGGYIGAGAGKVREMISGQSPTTGATDGQQKTAGQTVTEKAAAILPESVLGYVAPSATTTVPPADSAAQLEKQEGLDLGTQDNHTPALPPTIVMGKSVSPDQDVQEAVRNSKEDYAVPVNVAPSPSPTPLATTASPPPAPVLEESASSPAPVHKKNSPVANAASHLLPKLPHNRKQEKQQSDNTDLDQLSTRAVGGGTSISSLSNTNESSANTSIAPAANVIPLRPNPETLYPDVLLPNSKFSEEFTPLAKPITPLANDTQNGRRLPQAFVHRPPKEISPISSTAPSAFKDTPSPTSSSKFSKDIPASPSKSKFRTSLRKLTHKRDGSNASVSNGAVSEGEISGAESLGNGNGQHRERRKLRRASHGQTTGQEKAGLVERIKNVVKPHPHEV